MILQQPPLTRLSEADRIWIDRFAAALRARDPRHAAVDVARLVFGSGRFRSLSPPEAVAAGLER